MPYDPHFEFLEGWNTAGASAQIHMTCSKCTTPQFATKTTTYQWWCHNYLESNTVILFGSKTICRRRRRLWSFGLLICGWGFSFGVGVFEFWARDKFRGYQTVTALYYSCNTYCEYAKSGGQNSNLHHIFHSTIHTMRFPHLKYRQKLWLTHIWIIVTDICDVLRTVVRCISRFDWHHDSNKT